MLKIIFGHLWPRGFKKKIMLNPAEHENSNPYLINPMQFAGS